LGGKGGHLKYSIGCGRSLGKRDKGGVGGVESPYAKNHVTDGRNP